MYRVRLKSTSVQPSVRLFERVFLRGEISEVSKDVFDKLQKEYPDEFTFIKDGSATVEVEKKYEPSRGRQIDGSGEAEVWLSQNAKTVLKKMSEARDVLTKEDLEILLKVEKEGKFRAKVIEKIKKYIGDLSG